MSALPAARRTLLGCQSTDRTVERMGFLRSLDTHQSPSGSNEQIAMALHKIRCLYLVRMGRRVTYLAPLATANLSSFGLHFT